MTDYVKVYIRIRPINRYEKSEEIIAFVDPNVYIQVLIIQNDSMIKIGKSTNFYEGMFDRIYTREATQEEIFENIKPLVEDLFLGINNTVFTYGQTGSGKTYTIFGSDWTEYENLNQSGIKNSSMSRLNELHINPFSDTTGLIPRFISRIFMVLEKENMDKYKHCVYFSFMQIYNEKIYDLLEVSKYDLSLS